MLHDAVNWFTLLATPKAPVVRAAKNHIDGLLQIHRMEDGAARAGVWRQSIAALAAEAFEQRPVPLEGLEPAELEAGLRVALAQGLIDDLGWLSPAHAAAALYELANALPIGDVRRDLGRRVLQRLQEGNAQTFSVLGAQLAMGSRKVLNAPHIRARVALALELASGTQGRAGSLALSLLSHPELTRDWLSVPSTGALPSRRLAARLLECAALEIVRRASQGDRCASATIDQPGVHAAWGRLLADREPMVWHHAAIARGLLCGVLPHLEDEIERSLDPVYTPTEWRRAAASLAARVGVEPSIAVARCHDLLRSEVLQRDPGITSSMVRGLAWALEAEPEAANELLNTLIVIGNVDTLEAFVALRRDAADPKLAAAATAIAKQHVESPHFARANDDGRMALLRALRIELGADSEHATTPGLNEVLASARLAYIERDAAAAYAQGLELLGVAAATVDRIAVANQNRHDTFLAVRDLDRALLESQMLVNLLWLGSTSAEAAPIRRAHALCDTVGSWLMSQEQGWDESNQSAHMTLRARQWRAVLHYVDAGVGGADKSSQLREDRLKRVRLLLQRLHERPAPALRRIVGAATARLCDALLRDELVELSDLLTLLAFQLREADDLMVLSEASMDPAASTLLEAYAQLVKQTTKASQMTGQRMRVGLESLGAVLRAIPAPATPRVEALREALFAFVESLQPLQIATALAALSSDDDLAPSRLSAFAEATALLVRLTRGARRRMGEKLPDTGVTTEQALRGLDVALAWALRENDPRPMQPAVDNATAALHEVLPAPIANIAIDALAHVAMIPVASPFAVEMLASVAPPQRAALPGWLPPSRVIGGFYVLRPLGTGSVGSVFVVCRAEERGRPHAQRFALKVPEYGGDAARTLSQQEFYRLFREEAGALLSVPDHPNLARLVTFDAGAHPKPVLVMELVEGLTLQRLIDTAALDVPGAFDLLDGVAAGLEAMHTAGVGHLDVKPSNVILREAHRPPASVVEARPVPVLVDFGLAGRTIRPGCATVHYGAPELWGYEVDGAKPTPADVDVYAFGCLVYETLFGEDLFAGPTQMAVIARHLQGHGNLTVLGRMSKRTDFSRLAAVIRGAVRRDFQQRAPLAKLRRELREVAAEFASWAWPLSLRSTGPQESHDFPMSQALPLVRRRTS